MDNQIKELALQKGFTEKEQKMLDLFWQPAFNKSWIYVSEEMVRDHMGYKEGPEMMAHFYKRVLVPNLEKEAEYREATADDPVVRAYFALTEKSRQKDTSKVRENKKYYIVSGEGFKNLLMLSGTERGKETRRYYIKVESLAQEMVVILANIEKQRLADEKQQLTDILSKKEEELAMTTKKFENQLAVIEKTPQPLCLFDQLWMQARKPLEKNESVYIMTSKKYYQQSIFKIGRTVNVKQRQISLNTSNLKEDDLYVLHEVKTANSKDLESRVKYQLEDFRVQDNREFYVSTFKALKNIIEYVEDGRDEDVKFTLDEIADARKNFTNCLEGLPDNAVKALTSKPAAPAWRELEDERALIVVDAINNYAAAHSIDYNYVDDSRTKNIIFEWSAIQPYVKSACENPTVSLLAKLKTTLRGLKTYGAKVQVTLPVA